MKIIRKSQQSGSELGSNAGAPTATRTRDLLLRRRFHDIARWCPMWRDVAVTWSFARLTGLDVAWIMGLLAISLAVSETLT